MTTPTPVFATPIFESLAAKPFTHAAVGDLAQIHDGGVNVVVGTRRLSPVSIDYLNQVNVKALTQASTTDTPFGVGYKFRLGGTQLKRGNFLGGVARVFTKILPKYTGFSTLVYETSLILGDLSDAYCGRLMSNQWFRKRRYSGDIDFVLIANGEGSIGGFHRDNFTEHRSLMTLKGEGTLGADDSVRTQVALPRAFSDRESKSVTRNNYGYASVSFAHVIRQAPRGQLLVWHGDATPNPFIHSEYPVVRPEDTRLTLMAVPHEMNVRDFRRSLFIPLYRNVLRAG